jgi:hypothetical protein
MNFPWLSPTENWNCSNDCRQENTSARAPRKTPSSIAKDVCLQRRCLETDVLLFRAFAFTGTCLPTRYLAMVIYVTVLSTHLCRGFLVGPFLLAFPPISYIHSSSHHSCYMWSQSHPPWFDHSNYTWRRLQVVKLLIMLFSRYYCHVISLQSKYSPQHPVLKHPQSMFLP